MIIKCENCGLEYLREVKYCGKCGKFLRTEIEKEIICSSCNHKALHGALYCAECGKKLPRKLK